MLPAALWGLLLCLNPQQEPEVQNLIPEQLADAWHGNLDRWTIEDGQLIGRTTVAVSSLFAGGAIVHNLYAPDLVCCCLHATLPTAQI